MTKQMPRATLARTWIAGAAVLLLACGDPSVMLIAENVTWTPSLAISTSGQLAIAYETHDGTATGHVAVFDGAKWNSLGDAVPYDNGVEDPGPQIAFQPDGTLLLKTKEPPFEDGAVLVRRWTGTAWESLGGPEGVVGVGQHVFSARMALDSVGAPVIAAVLGQIGASPKIALRRWDGATWTPIASDDVVLPNTLTVLYDFVLDSADQPLLLLEDRGPWSHRPSEIARWDGAAWQRLALESWAADLALDSSGAPLALFFWDQVSLARFDGASWTASPETKGIDGDSWCNFDASMAPDSSGGAFVAWSETRPTPMLWPSERLQVYVQRWTGEAWERVLGPLSGGRGDTANVRVAVGGPYTAVPVVAWMESVESSGTYSSILFARVPR